MKNTLIITLISLILCSCDKNKNETQSIIPANKLTEKQIDSVMNKFAFSYESPIIIDSSEFVLFPMSTKLLDVRKLPSYSTDGYKYQSNDLPRYWNVLFYNRNTTETRLLTEKKFRISKINAKEDESDYGGGYETQVLKGKILYRISDLDYNQDDKLDRHDPDFLFVSDLDGKHLFRISPLNEDLQTFEIIPNSKQILLKTIRDVNQDSVFNSDDLYIWYKAQMVNNKWTIHEVVDPVLNKKVQRLYFDQWLIKKQGTTAE